MWDKFLHLTQNIHLGHSEADNQHAQWLLEIGAGSTMDNNEMIQVPQSMVCANLNGLINRIYPGIGNSRAQDDQYFLDHIILCPRNDQVHDINEAILQQFNPTAEIHILRSVDFVWRRWNVPCLSCRVSSTTQCWWIASCFTLSQGWLSSYLIEELGSRRRTL